MGRARGRGAPGDRAPEKGGAPPQPPPPPLLVASPRARRVTRGGRVAPPTNPRAEHADSPGDQGASAGLDPRWMDLPAGDSRPRRAHPNGGPHQAEGHRERRIGRLALRRAALGPPRRQTVDASFLCGRPHSRPTVEGEVGSSVVRGEDDRRRGRLQVPGKKPRRVGGGGSAPRRRGDRGPQSSVSVPPASASRTHQVTSTSPAEPSASLAPWGGTGDSTGAAIAKIQPDRGSSASSRGLG